MRRHAGMIGLALTFSLAADLAFAKGGYVRPPQLVPFRASVVPLPSLPTVSLPAGPLIGGCGPKRYRDPQTHQCRGPADVH